MKNNRITKSFSLLKTPELVEWINAQSNFSNSIRCLIQQSIASHGGHAVDVSLEHEKMVHNLLYQNNPSDVSLNTNNQTQNYDSNSPKVSVNDSPSPEKSKIGFNTFASSKETVISSLDSSDIPEEYF